ncbi:hypothetical protein [Streptomyces sp. NPDC001530]|uniref:hypothetical protein n=1 Tax=Streptomyces sp. NPDC001530 TaxID=3364582 RepID=UPI003689214C
MRIELAGFAGRRIGGEQMGHARGDLNDADHPAFALQAGSDDAGNLGHALRSVGGQVQVLAGPADQLVAPDRVAAVSTSR